MYEVNGCIVTSPSPDGERHVYDSPEDAQEVCNQLNGIHGACCSCNYPYHPIVWSGIIGEDLVCLCAGCHSGLTASGAFTDPWVRCLVTARRHMSEYFAPRTPRRYSEM